MWSPTPTVAPGPSYPAARKPGFFQRLSIGWKLTKVSLGILRKEKGLVLLPFVSLLITVGVWAIFFVSLFFVVAPTDPVGSWLFYVGLAVVYFVTFFVSIYFNAAVMGAAMIRLNGGDPTISDGLKVARANIRRIAGWLLRQTWGEAAGGYLTLGGIFVLLALPALLVILLGVVVGGVVGLLVGLAIAVVYWLILGLVGSAAQSILVTALYRYATTGELGFGLPRDLVAPPAGTR